MAKTCSKEGCTNKVFSHGLCSFHAPKKAIKKTPLKKKPPTKVPPTRKAAQPHKKSSGRRKSIKTLKTRLDRVFSIYVRMRDADKEGYVNCITSGKRLFWKESQCGHFMSRRFNSTRYHEKNTHAQSMYSNMYLSGEQYIYGLEIDRIYGEGTAAEIVALSKTDFKLTIEWLEDKIKHYTKEVERLKREKGL